MTRSLTHVENGAFIFACGGKKSRKPVKPFEVKAGDKVMRKSDKSRLAIGDVLRVTDSRIYIRWPAPHRLGGEFHHTNIKRTTTDLIIATPLAVAERRRDVRLAVVCGAIRSFIAYSKRDGDAYHERQINEKVRWLMKSAYELEGFNGEQKGGAE